MKLFLLLLLFIFEGCISQNAELNLVKNKPHRIIFTANVTDAEAAGGLMFWGKNTNGDSFARVATNKTATVDVSNGNWTWYAMAWSGENGVDQNGNGTTNDPMAGTITCSSTPQFLKGQGKKAVTLNFTNATCSTETAFVGSDSAVVEDIAGVKYLSRVKVQFCESLNGINSYDDLCTDDILGNVEPGREEARGHALSYRLSLVSYDRDNGSSYNFVPGIVHSACVSGKPSAVNSGIAPNELWQVPSGIQATGTPFYMKMETFPGSTNCDDSTHGKSSINFPTGIAYTSTAVEQYIDTSLPLRKHQLFVKMSGDEICSLSGSTQTFSGGDGSNNSPFLICNVKQLYNIYIDNGTTIFSYKLLADIDLTPYYQSVNRHPSQPTNACLKDGSNFFPIGINTFNCTTVNGINMVFDGGGKTIKGMRIIMPGVTTLGFMSRFSSGEVRRIRFEKAYVEGDSQVGIVTGVNTVGVHVSNIEVHDSEVKALTGYVGGIAGIGGLSGFNKVKLTKTKVSTTASYAGGIAGQTNSGTPFIDCLFSGEVRSGGVAGGIVGGINFGVGAIITRSRFEGYVEGLQSVGGLVGEAGLMKIQNSYAQGNIHGRLFSGPFVANTQYVGGLIGHVATIPSATSFVKESYFLGKVSHSCGAQATGCGVGNVFGIFSAGWNNPNAFFDKVYFNRPIITGYQTVLPAAQDVDAVDFITAASAVIFSGGTPFVKFDGDIPRLQDEIAGHPCRSNAAFESVLTQVNPPYNRGTTIADPIQLCNGSQITDIQNNLDKHYKLMNYVTDYNEQGFSNTVFTGSIDGDGYGLIGKTVASGNNNQTSSWFLDNQGTIKNLSLLGASLSNNGFVGGSAAPIAVLNSGTIDNVKILGLQSTFVPNFNDTASGVVNRNIGTISNLEINGFMIADNYTTGISKRNLGSITDVKNSLYFYAYGQANSISATVLQNDGFIERHEINARFEFQKNVPASDNITNVTIDNFANGEIRDIHLRSGQFEGSGIANHAIAKNNAGLIEAVYNQTRTILHGRASIPVAVPANAAEWQNHFSATIADTSGAGVAQGIFFTTQPRWLYGIPHIFAPDPLGVPAIQIGNDCLVEVRAAQPTYLSLWEDLIDDSLATGQVFLATSTTAPLLQKIIARDEVLNTPLFDKFLINQPTNNCANTNGGSTTYVTYQANDRTLTPNPANTVTVWSAWHDLFNDFTTVKRLDVVSEQQEIQQIRYDLIQDGTTSTTPPVWVFTQGTGIHLFGR